MHMIRPIIAGNWKMNVGPEAARDFFRSFSSLYRIDPKRTIIFFPPAVTLSAARAAAADRQDLRFGVQNVHWESAGAFTGEISAPLARDAGADYVLVGHSERRHVFGETSEATARKVAAVLQVGLVPVLCVGETIAERRGDRAEAVVLEQLAAVLDDLEVNHLASLIIAYEPVWAIGTGETATPQDAADMHGAIRRELARRYGGGSAAAVPILYGGSVKPENAAELMGGSDVDGVLVGGASLDAAGFARICESG